MNVLKIYLSLLICKKHTAVSFYKCVQMQTFHDPEHSMPKC